MNSLSLWQDLVYDYYAYPEHYSNGDYSQDGAEIDSHSSGTASDDIDRFTDVRNSPENSDKHDAFVQNEAISRSEDVVVDENINNEVMFSSSNVSHRRWEICIY